MEWHDALADYLGAERQEDGQRASVWGRRGPVDFALGGDLHGPEMLCLRFLSDKSSHQIRLALSQSLAVKAALAEAWLVWSDDSCRLEPDRLRYLFGHSIEVTKESLSRILDAVAAELGALPMDEGCHYCSEPGSLRLSGGEPERICPNCLEQKAGVFHSLGSLLGAWLENLPLGLVVDRFSHLDLERESQRLGESLRGEPKRFWRHLLLWVVLGQIGLSLGLLFVLAILGLILILFGLALRWHLAGVLYWILKAIGPKLLPLVLLLPVLVGGLWRSVKLQIGGFSASPEELPPGHWVERNQPGFESLFLWVDEVSQRSQAPRVDSLLLCDQVNAFASEVRRGRKRILVVGLGLPLLEFLSPEELQVLLLHELAHLKHDDTRRLWVYRTAQAWKRVASLSVGHTLLGLQARFCGWFYPRFLLRAQLVSRRAELAADQLACQILGPGVVASTLARIQVLQYWYERKKEALPAYRVANQALSEDPVDQLWEQLTRLSQKEIAEGLKEALEATSKWSDEHPSLAERLQHLGVDVPEELSLTRSGGGRALLNDCPSQLFEEVYRGTRSFLRLRSEEAFLSQQRLLSKLEALPLDSHYQRARLLQNLQRLREALAEYDVFLERVPGHLDARLARAQVLHGLDRQEEARTEVLAMKDRGEADQVGDRYALVFLLDALGEDGAKEELLEKWMSPGSQPRQVVPFSEPPPDDSPLTFEAKADRATVVIPPHPHRIWEARLVVLLSLCWIPLSLWALHQGSVRQRDDNVFLLIVVAIVTLVCSLWGLLSRWRTLIWPSKVEIREGRVRLHGFFAGRLNASEVALSQEQNAETLEHRVRLKYRGRDFFLATGYSPREIRWLLRFLRHAVKQQAA